MQEEKYAAGPGDRRSGSGEGGRARKINKMGGMSLDKVRRTPL